MTTLEIFYDYLCPYVYRASRLMADVQALLQDDLSVEWRYFPLTQVNNKREGWHIWEQPSIDSEWNQKRSAVGLRGFWGAEAARQQGETAFRRFHIALLKAVHEEGLKIDDDTVRTAARIAELDLERWEQAYSDTDLLERVRIDYETARERGIFGVPTFVFPDAEPAYLKLNDVVPADEVDAYWQTLVRAVAEQPLFLEVKRPH